jgi:hypothetical protein
MSRALADIRIYNPSIGKFLSVDPLTKSYPWYTPYQFAGNKPIAFIDLDGLEEYKAPKPGCTGSIEGETNTTTAAFPSGANMGSVGKYESTTWYWNVQSEDWYDKDQYEYLNLNTESGQVLPPTFQYNPLPREWNEWEVDNDGYLNGEKAPLHVGWPPIGAGPKVVQGVGVVLNMAGAANKGTKVWAIYHGMKEVSGKFFLYIGKAKNGVSTRYSTKDINKFQITAFEKLKSIPDNATA